MKPQWLKITPPTQTFHTVRDVILRQRLHTVCQEAHCPNMADCWSSGTATFMVMGDICTRGCRFCAVKKGRPGELDQDEPRKLAAAIKELGIFDYIVVTSVDRDDLEDQGSNHFAECIREIKQSVPGIRVEVLIPDFQGRLDLLLNVISAGPDCIAHNIETVERLQRSVRDIRAGYTQSLKVLENVKIKSNIVTKSSIMLGLGEKEEEVRQALEDLKDVGCDIITFGQYLKPKNRTLAVEEYVRPEKFKYYEELARSVGFEHCVSGPFMRSSYKAGDIFRKVIQ